MEYACYENVQEVLEEMTVEQVLMLYDFYEDFEKYFGEGTF